VSKWDIYTFDDVIIDDTKNGTKIKKEDYLKKGLYPVIDQGKNQIAGYLNSDDGLYKDSPAIIFGDHTRVIKYIDTPFFLGADGVKLLKSRKSNISIKYLYYFFIKNRIPKTGYNRHFKWLKELTIPLPPLATQKQIAITLDTAAELLAMRKQQLAELDNLIKSTFYDMFGDPFNNDKGWEFKTLDDICIKITDGEHINPTFVNNGIRMVMANNVRDNVDFNGCKYISDKDYKKFSKKCNPELGDVLLVSRGATIGRACINDSLEKFSLMGSVILLKPNKNIVDRNYLLSWLQNKRVRPYIVNTSSASAQQAIYMKDLKKRTIFYPPLSLQNHFASKVTKIEEQKALVKKAIDETQYLFDSLISEYFE
jgi:type I restriction enzyme S subunit